MKKFQKMRSGFSMIMAIFVIVVMSILGAYVMSYANKSALMTTSQYQHTQAILYAYSYTEYAILAVTGNDRTKACLETIKGDIGNDPEKGEGYRVLSHISYIANGNEVNLSQCDSKQVFSSSVTTAKTPLTIIVDTYVKYKDINNPSGPWLSVHRRSINKI